MAGSEPAAKARLAAEVARWVEAADGGAHDGAHEAVVLFFDGRAELTVEEAVGRVEVHFAGSGRPGAADDAVVARAAAGDRVVTADRGLIARLPDGVEVVGPRHLLDLLEPSADH